ncbi:hypothetical protein H4582DRAFT_2086557 [Lactarius indigo]|nr:hypothetical protein H4582DRAFT_2086557 [Lactarius indigo]
MLERCTRELQAESGTVAATAFGTSIYDETLYKAWSYIVHTIVPNAAVFSKHLTTFARATEVTLSVATHAATDRRTFPTGQAATTEHDLRCAENYYVTAVRGAQ